MKGVAHIAGTVNDYDTRACFMTRKKSRHLGLAAAVLVSCGAASIASATTVYTQSNLAGPGEGCQFVALVDADLHRPPIIQFKIGSTSGGPMQQSLDLPPSDQFDSYAIFGRDSAGGVFVSFANAGTGVGVSFDNLFPGFSEAQLAADLLSNGPLVPTFAGLLAQMSQACTPMGSTSSITDFSVGTDYGTFQASFTPVPEPASAALILGTAASASLIRRRSKVRALR